MLRPRVRPDLRIAGCYHPRVRRLAQVGALLTALAPTGCTPWIVIQSSGPPSALRSEPYVQVGFDYSNVNLYGYDEATFLSNKSPKQLEDYRSVKTALNQSFFASYHGRIDGVTLVEPSTQPVLTLTVSVLLLTQGKYAVAYAEPTRVIARCLWWKGDQRYDEIELEAVVDAGIGSTSIIGRVTDAGASLGERCARYHNEARK